MSVESKEAVESMKSTNDEPKKSKKKGVLSRLWNAIFRSRGDDFEKRLEHISKEERAALKRLENRRQLLHKMTRHFFFCVLLLEIIAVSYAIVTTRSEALNWKTRASCVLPMFLLPPGSFMVYSFIKWVFRTLDQKDQKTVERLRAERRAKIDELKEKTNYYSTQQLIQRYDPDPAAKAAAATVLASKLGVESGLKVQLTENVDPNPASGKSNDVEVSRTGGLRHRKQPLSRSASLDSGSAVVEANLGGNGFNGAEGSQQNPLVVEHHPQTSSTSNNGGWLAQLAALLVGEDPTQSYALICGNCRMHNGLARKEDFPYITYYCPHCRALNRPKDADETHIPASASSPLSASLPGVEVVGETEETVSSTDKHSAPPDPAPAPATASAPPNLFLGSS